MALLALVRRGPAAAWLTALSLAAALLGLAIGSARIAAIDAGALDLPRGAPVAIRGFVAAVPRRSGAGMDVPVETAGGRLIVRVAESQTELEVGDEVSAVGAIRDPPAWQRDRFARLGVRDLLATRALTIEGGRRDGLEGVFDRIRGRAGSALASGTSPQAAALLRGFVLGEDDAIEPSVVDDFKRSGLAHLLAVSGQNVVLLAILAAAVLAALGVGLRARLAWILAAIAVYVPVAGAGPSIQRAGVMGAAGVVAALAGRPSSRWYALLLAAAATLALDPRASADIGWQLSFAAVLGILLAARPIAAALAGAAGDRHPARRALAEGAALTLAATIATAPLMALHFGTFSVVTIPANLVALPAEAPVMWLGMLTAGLGQVPWLPVAPLSWLAGVLAGWVAQVARWFASPAWAQAEVALSGPSLLIAVYLALAVGVAVCLRALARRRGLAPRRRRAPVLAVCALALAFAVPGLASDPVATSPGLRLTVLDVGQGDSILLEPDDADPILIDTGPAQAQVAEQLAERGVERLAALVITHPEADHDGGAGEVLARIPTDRLVFARARRSTLAAARAYGAEPVRVAAGTRLSFGALRLDAVWPPRERLAGRASADLDANLLALVLVARWHGFDALLTADAEAEAAPIDPGEVELLKVAHHGSEDAGLAALVRRVEPRLGVISVGESNSYGHPAPATLATLAAAGVPVLRTDVAGAVTVEVRNGGWTVR